MRPKIIDLASNELPPEVLEAIAAFEKVAAYAELLAVLLRHKRDCGGAQLKDYLTQFERQSHLGDLLADRGNALQHAAHVLADCKGQA